MTEKDEIEEWLTYEEKQYAEKEQVLPELTLSEKQIFLDLKKKLMLH